MATLPVVYALGVFVMVSYISEAQDGVSNVLTLVPKRNIENSPSDPRSKSTEYFKEGHSITFLCSVNWVTNPVVYWYRINHTHYAAYVRYHNGVCDGGVGNKLYVKLHVGNTSCKDNSYELRIRDIDQEYEGGWYCLVDNKWQSGYIYLKVDIHNDGKAPTYANRQPGNVEAVVMEGNPLYLSNDQGTDDYAQIDCRESASPSHEKGGAIVVNNQPNPDDGKQSQAVLDSGDIYAMPDKSKKSAAEEKGEARLVSSQPNPGDRNQGQAVLDSGDIYAVPDKSKKSAAQDVEDVYNQVQKPKK